jgi:hypothetical protein
LAGGGGQGIDPDLFYRTVRHGVINAEDISNLKSDELLNTRIF